MTSLIDLIPIDGADSTTDTTKGAALIGWRGSNVGAYLDNLSSTRTISNISATSAGQTTFTVPGGYTIGQLDVFLNGFHLSNGTDYIASTGTTIVLQGSVLIGSVSIGSVLSVSALNTFAVANTVSPSSLAASNGAGLVGFTQNGIGASLRTVLGKLFDYPMTPFDFAAKGDTLILTDGAMTSGSASLSSASAVFTPADVGKVVSVTGAGAGGVPLGTTISAWVSSTQVTLSATASTTVSGAKYSYGTDDSNALQALFTAATLYNVDVLIPGYCFTVTKTLTFGGRIIGVPRKSKLCFSAAFTYSGYGNQFALMNSNFSLSYSSTTAQHIRIEGVDIIAFKSAAGGGFIGLANISSGQIDNVVAVTSSSSRIDSFIDLYAVVKNVTIRRCNLQNLTQAGSAGGCVWIRNLTSDGTQTYNITENITFEDNYLGHTGFDEAIAVYGVGGMTRRVMIRQNTIEGLVSVTPHGTLASTFPLGASQGGTANAAIQDVIWENNRFIDVNFQNEVLRFGTSADAAYKCQNVKSVNNAFYAQMPAANTGSIVLRNIKCTFDSIYSGNSSENDYIDTQGSPNQVNSGISGFDTVINPTIAGALYTGITGGAVTGGSVEAYYRAFYQCSSVTGSKFKIDGAGAAFQQDSSGTISRYSDCTGNSAGGLAIVNTGVTQVDIFNNTCGMSSGSAYAITNSGSARVRVRGNTFTGSGLTTSGTIADTSGNDYFGTIS
jgi:hypothetical protein